MYKTKYLNKINRIGINSILEEIGLLRSAFIGIAGKDLEGEYSPKFVEQIFKDCKKKDTCTFEGKKSFLKSLK